MALRQADLPLSFKPFPLAVAVQVVVGARGLFTGSLLRKLRARARTTLEVLSWLLFVFVVGFMRPRLRSRR